MFPFDSGINKLSMFSVQRHKGKQYSPQGHWWFRGLLSVWVRVRSPENPVFVGGFSLVVPSF